MRTEQPSMIFAVSPRFDLFYALYAIADEAASPLEEWKAHAVRRLPSTFGETAERIAPRPIFWPLLADTLQNAHGELAFEQMVDSLKRLSAADLKANILSGIFHDAATVQSLVSGKKNIRQVVEGGQARGNNLLAHFGLWPYDARSPYARAISTILAHPDGFRDDLVATLQQFWENVFGGDWAALEPGLQADSLWMRELEGESTLERVASELRLPVAFDNGTRQVRPKHGPAIPYDRIEHCYLLPSAFNTRRWWAKYEAKGGRVNLYFPVFRERPIARPRDPDTTKARAARLESRPIRAELVFRALGDTTRYAIASILARSPTTSAELARRLRVSKPTITHHIQTLRSAGLIDEGRAGGSTPLSLNREILAGLSIAALDQLFSAAGDLTLDTTRKRRTP